ncbi:Uncharacterised protein [Yersinia pseudotuberculosis]|nr:Uncharacterised protein [Yersinia pseudotuberculosis]CNJ14409.1 Uncharacterised protein [Yersinia pseudotuberculosis]CNJ52269.1 Uncharacterised protein [Yersinia pseudotuberculosis]
MLKPYPFLKQDTYAWCLSIGNPPEKPVCL